MSRAAKPAKPQPTMLYMSTNSLRNTVFSAPADSITYEIRTTWWDPNITRVSRIDVESRQITLVAEIERKPDTEPRLRLNWIEAFNQFRNASEWLKVPVMKKVCGGFEAIDGTTYWWSIHKGHLMMAKEREKEKEQPPLVTYHKHHRHFYVYWRMSKHACLEVSQECIANLDAIVVSYLLVERMRRDGFYATG